MEKLTKEQRRIIFKLYDGEISDKQIHLISKQLNINEALVDAYLQGFEDGYI